MNGVFEEIVDLHHEYDGHPDRLYVDSNNYHELLSDASFRTAAADVQMEQQMDRVFGLDVIVVPDLEQSLMVLDSAQFPKARDFKKGYVQPVDLSSRHSY